MKHSIFPVVAVLFTSFLFIACADKAAKGEPADTGTKEPVVKEEKSGAATKLEGAWEIIRATGDMASMNVGTVYEFSGNKLFLKSAGFSNPGTTVVTGNTFSFQADGNELSFVYDYRVEADTLIVSMQKSNQTFYMVKK